MKEKVCIVVARKCADGPEILVLKHPTAGAQLIKGSPHQGEPLDVAAARELFEESGLVADDLFSYTALAQDALNERWHIFICTALDTPDTWSHQTTDDCGHVFFFFWQKVNTPVVPDMAPQYRRVLDHLLGRLLGP